MAINCPKSGRFSNVTQKGAEKTKRYCTSQTLQASVSMLNVKIQDKIVIKEATSMACSGGAATQKHLFREEKLGLSGEHYSSKLHITVSNFW